MREIKIYLAYAPEDKPYDREELGNFIRQQNDIARKRRDPVFLRLVECEDQDWIPEDTMLVLSLSVTHAGGKELLEQLWEEEKSPAIMTYFRMPDKDVPIQESYLRLKEWLGDRGHYWNEYPDIAVVMFKLLVYFQQKKIDGFFYTKEDGEIRLDGIPVLKSRDFCALREHSDMKCLDEQIEELDAQLREGRMDGDLDAYKERMIRRNALRKQKMSIIRTYYEQLEDTADAVSDRVRRARSAVARGDFSKAEQILDPEQIRRHADENICQRTAAIAEAEAQGRRELKMRLQEYLECARVLQMKVQNEERIHQVRKVLLEAVDLELREDLGRSARAAHVEYLLQWVPAGEAVPYAREQADSFPDNQISPEHAHACQLLAKAYRLAEENSQTIIAAYDQAVRIWRELFARDKEAWLTRWVECCNERIMAADSHSKQQIQNAEALAEAVWEELESGYYNGEAQVRLLTAKLYISLGELAIAAGDNGLAEYYFATPLDFLIEDKELQHPVMVTRVILQLGLGVAHLQRGGMEDAVKCLKQALTSFDKLPAQAAAQHQRVRFRIQTYLGHALMPSAPEGAEACYQDALQILNDKLGQNMEDQADKASVLAALGVLRAQRGLVKEAQEHWRNAEALCEILRDQCSGSTLLTLIRTYRFIGDGYLYARKSTKDEEYKNDARRYFTKAAQLHERLETPDFQAGFETWTLFGKYMGVFDRGDKKACKALYKRLSRLEKYNDQQDKMQLATYYINFAMICQGAGEMKEAESAYSKGLEAYWPYVQQVPHRRALRYAEYAVLYSRVLWKISNRLKAVGMLQEVKNDLANLGKSQELLDAFGMVCAELARLYTILHQEKACDKVSKEYKRAREEWPRLFRIGKGGRV